MLWTKGIWKVPPDKDPNHPATFPIEIAERIIRLYSFKGDLVLDPFARSGTTLIAAEKAERKSIGYEIAKEYKTATIEKTNKWLTVISTFGLQTATKA